MDYYDIVLALIPVALFGIAGVLWIAGMGLPHSLFGGSLVSFALIGHALFINGPTDPARRPDSATGLSKSSNSNPNSGPLSGD